MLRTKYNSKDTLPIIKEVFNSKNTHAVYHDTDSVIIDGRDKTPCMYDYAGLILIIADLAARRGEMENHIL